MVPARAPGITGGAGTGPGAVPAAPPFPVSHTGKAQLLPTVPDLNASPALAKDRLCWGSSGEQPLEWPQGSSWSLP